MLGKSSSFITLINCSCWTNSKMFADDMQFFSVFHFFILLQATCDLEIQYQGATILSLHSPSSHVHKYRKSSYDGHLWACIDARFRHHSASHFRQRSLRLLEAHSVSFELSWIGDSLNKLNHAWTIQRPPIHEQHVLPTVHHARISGQFLLETTFARSKVWLGKIKKMNS